MDFWNDPPRLEIPKAMFRALIQAEPDKPPYGALWLLFFAFTAAVAIMIQFVILGLVFPQWSSGNGLLLWTDSTGYHRLAVLMAERIQAEGWAVWEITPGGHFSVGLPAALYALFLPEPWVMIPLAAGVTALSGLVLLRICLFFTNDWRVAALATAPYLLFPAASFWYAQLLKDTYFNLGILLFSCGWMTLACTGTWKQGWRSPILGLVFVLVGYAVMIVIRPYALTLMGSAAQPLAIISVLILLVQARRKVLPLGRVLIAIATIGVLVATLTAGRERIVTAKNLPLGLTLSSETVNVEGRRVTAERFWEPTPWLPKFFDRKLATIAGVRHVYHRVITARSRIDSEIDLKNASELLHYLPRAAQIAFLAPFPSEWLGRGSTGATTMMRRISMAEMLLAYLALAFVPFALWRWRLRGEIWILTAFCAMIMLVYAVATPNVGTLYRIRYAYLMQFVALGILAMGSLWRQIREARSGARAHELGESPTT